MNSSRMSAVAVLLLALAACAHAAGEDVKASVAHRARTVNPAGECPHSSGKVVFEGDKSYESYESEEAYTEHNGHRELVDPSCGRPHGVIDDTATKTGSIAVTLTGTTITVLPATTTDAADLDAEIKREFTVIPKEDSDKCAGDWSFESKLTLDWTAGSLTVAGTGSVPTEYTITGSFGCPSSKTETVMDFEAELKGPNKKALDVCFTPPDITTCTIDTSSIGGTTYCGTIVAADSSDITSPYTIQSWLYRGFFLQDWHTKHVTFKCVITGC